MTSPAKKPSVIQVRIDLVDAQPPIWRRLELLSTLGLDQVHWVIQAAFGWDNSHLHRFIAGKSIYDNRAPQYLCDYEADEVDEGVPEWEAQLGDVLRRKGSVLTYWYDYGDDWVHRILQESVRPAGPDDPPARLITGRRAAPPDDIGGVWQFQNLIAMAREPADPADSERAETLEWFRDMLDVDSIDDYDPAYFDIEGTAARVSRLRFSPSD